jgi:O-antigen ligase
MRLLSTGLLGLFMAHLALRQTWTWRRSPMDLSVLAWSLWLLVKTVHSVSTSISWRGEYENFAGSLTQLNYSLLFFFALQWVRDLRQAKVLLLCLEASALAAGVYAIFQALGLDFIAWAANTIVMDRYFSTLGNPNFLGALMIMALALVAARAFWEPEAPSQSKLWAHAAYMAFLPLACLGLYLFFPPGHSFVLGDVAAKAQSGAFDSMVLYLAGLLLAGGLILKNRLKAGQILLLFLEALILFKALANTGTRGAFMGLMASVAFFAGLGYATWLRREAAKAPAATASPESANSSPKSRRWLGLGAGAALLFCLGLASLAMGPGLRLRMTRTLFHPLEAFDESRMEIWLPALDIWRAFPITGTGVDTFKTVFPQFTRAKFAKYDGENVASRMAHCEPLQILATMGLIGLALWIWLLWVWGRSWLHLWTQAPASPATQGRDLEALLAALAGLSVAYLVQNLVSFGVSGISAPFFISLGLLGSAGASFKSPSLQRPAWAKPVLLLGLIPFVLWGAWAATATFRADMEYNFGNMVTSELEILEKAPALAARQTARYALNELNSMASLLSPEQAQESNAWYQRLADADAKLGNQDPENSRDLPLYRSAAESLLLVLSSARQSLGVALAPGEVKYHVYLGLAYEELYKRSLDPGLKAQWAGLAEKEYREGIRLNPRNAYYHGNLGRLYALRAQNGDLASLPKAEQSYQEATELAPVTKLFYENLLLLYAQYGRGAEGNALIQPLEAKDSNLASRLYLEAGTTFYQWANNFRAAGQSVSAAHMEEARDEALKRAQNLDPANPDVPYAQAIIAYYGGHKAQAKKLLLQALSLNPNYSQASSFLASNKF